MQDPNQGTQAGNIILGIILIVMVMMLNAPGGC